MQHALFRLCLIALVAGAQPAAAAEPQATLRGYDQALTGYAYPYEVKYLPLRVQEQDLRMAYMDVRPAKPNGETVLLLHGKNFSGAYWANSAARLSELGYRVLLPDQIGFGKSSKPTSLQYSFDLLASNTARLLDALKVERAAVVGHSMGGMLAVRFATRYPGRTQKLVLVNPIGLEDYRRLLPYLGVDGWTEQAAKQTAAGVKQYMLESYFHGLWRPEYDALLAIQTGFVVGPDRQALARVSALTQDMIYTQPTVYDLPAIRAPTLLIIGQKDRTAPGKGDVPPALAKTLGDYVTLGEKARAAIPRAELVKLEGVGHVPQYEAFAPYMAALERFLTAPLPRPADP
ncbi:MAG: alpha/beta hydrolase [Polyangiaceae bacterium]